MERCLGVWGASWSRLDTAWSERFGDPRERHPRLSAILGLHNDGVTQERLTESDELDSSFCDTGFVFVFFLFP